MVVLNLNDQLHFHQKLIFQYLCVRYSQLLPYEKSPPPPKDPQSDWREDLFTEFSTETHFNGTFKIEQKHYIFQCIIKGVSRSNLEQSTILYSQIIIYINTFLQNTCQNLI